MRPTRSGKFRFILTLFHHASIYDGMSHACPWLAGLCWGLRLRNPSLVHDYVAACTLGAISGRLPSSTSAVCAFRSDSIRLRSTSLSSLGRWHPSFPKIICPLRCGYPGPFISAEDLHGSILLCATHFSLYVHDHDHIPSCRASHDPKREHSDSDRMLC